jgi:hypothetical protein
MGLMDMLLQAASSSMTNHDDHLQQVAEHAPQDLLGHGLAEAFRSDQTPPFGQMAAQLFGQSSGGQQAGMLNSIIGALGPMAVASLAGGALSKLMAPGQTQITPEQAARLSPQQVQEIATHAQDQQPGVIDKLGSFYAEHPTLIKTLGGIAAAIAMSKMKDKLTEN